MLTLKVLLESLDEASVRLWMSGTVQFWVEREALALERLEDVQTRPPLVSTRVRFGVS